MPFGSRVQHRGASLAFGVACLALISACGSSGGTASSGTPTPVSVTPISTPATTAAPTSCPTGATVGGALGITLPKPVGVAGSGSPTQLPAGAKAEVCEYHAQTYNVIIEVITNIDPSNITKFSSQFPVAYATVSGVGDQARSFTVSLGGGKDNEGVVATKGSTLVALTATATPASLSQIEALVNQLL